MKVMLAIAGLDPSGGAGLLLDARVAHRLGYHFHGVCTAWTAQGKGGVSAWEPLDADAVTAQLGAVLAGAPLGGIKIGMVANAVGVDAVRTRLEAVSATVPVVWDPVLAASAGAALYRDPLDTLGPLLPRAAVLTPNLDEASRLTGQRVSSVAEMRVAARTLCERGAQAALITGGHLPGNPVDVLYDGRSWHTFPGRRLPAEGVRGTGCALSTAIVCMLGRGHALPIAIREAKDALAGWLAASHTLNGTLRYLL